MITHWDLGTRRLAVAERPLVMGILNVTPDSFSDGGQHHAPAAAIDAAQQMASDGADLIDIGGESTRPYSDPVGEQEELDRVMPVIEGLAGRLQIPISIDTSKAVVAEAAVAAGAEVINDVTGLEGDPRMIQVAAAAGVGVCVMHTQGTPQTMQDDPQYEDVVAEVREYLSRRRQACLEAGIVAGSVCLDPGIGFGKTHEHNLTLLRAVDQFVGLGAPVLIGHSRKGFIRHVLGDRGADPTGGSLGVSLAVAAAGAHVIRVHDVKLTADALRLFRAAGGFERLKH